MKWVLVALTLGSALMAGEAQWTLRFNEARAYSSVLTGCLGTASYEYGIAPIARLQEFHAALKSKAAEHQLTGFAWSKTRDPQDAGAYLALDLASGEVISVPERGENGNPRGLVFCLCRYAGLRHCSRSAVPPLGEPFTAYAD